MIYFDELFIRKIEMCNTYSRGTITRVEYQILRSSEPLRVGYVGFTTIKHGEPHNRTAAYDQWLKLAPEVGEGLRARVRVSEHIWPSYSKSVGNLTAKKSFEVFEFFRDIVVGE